MTLLVPELKYKYLHFKIPLVAACEPVLEERRGEGSGVSGPGLSTSERNGLYSNQTFAPVKTKITLTIPPKASFHAREILISKGPVRLFLIDLLDKYLLLYEAAKKRGKK